MSATQQIAQTTLKQLGGSSRLSAMIGAHNFTYGRDGELTFKFRGCRRINGVTIILDQGTDTYTVEFFKLQKLSLEDRGRHERIYCTNLRSLFESETGLYLSLS